MIRFLNLKNQIIEGTNSFAFYNTVRDEIIDFGGEQVFDSIEEFSEACLVDKEKSNLLDRCIGLIPKDFFDRKQKFNRIIEFLNAFVNLQVQIPVEDLEEYKMPDGTIVTKDIELTKEMIDIVLLLKKNQ